MAEKITPMMRQYRPAKEELPPGVILFFRLGDFFEMFQKHESAENQLIQQAFSEDLGGWD